tara:strand:+ start:114 stop:440 length:327 start_codon:yes stop_codon:yes gene_type:complete
MDIQTNNNERHQKAKILTGVIVLIFGVFYLLEKAHLNIPEWLVSWKSILIAAGIVALYKHRFQSMSGFVMLGVGSVFMINEFKLYLPNYCDHYWAFHNRKISKHFWYQ